MFIVHKQEPKLITSTHIQAQMIDVASAEALIHNLAENPEYVVQEIWVSDVTKAMADDTQRMGVNFFLEGFWSGVFRFQRTTTYPFPSSHDYLIRF